MTQDVERARDTLRKVRIHPNYICHAEGSTLIEFGNTRVICTASVEERVPPFLRGGNKGWVTAEYGMLPRSTGTRMVRESSRGKPSGRTQEISRLIGRSLRSVVNLEALEERTIWLDCDVIQADGGTRTAAITGAFVALALSIRKMQELGQLQSSPLLDFVAAVSVGIVDGVPSLDLCYGQDVNAEVDMNVVMTGQGNLVEVQGTAEGKPFNRSDLDELLDLAEKGISSLVIHQKEVLFSSIGDLSNLFPSDSVAPVAPSGDS